jgi:hypothetical protein
MLAAYCEGYNVVSNAIVGKRLVQVTPAARISDGNTVSAAQQRAAELALAYTTMTDDKTNITRLEVEVGNLRGRSEISR